MTKHCKTFKCPDKSHEFCADCAANSLTGIGINLRTLAVRVPESLCVSQFNVLLMRLLRAHSRKPASDIYLRDYLIGGVVWVKREACPHCYKTDLHPDASKCHHCGGNINTMGEGGCLLILVVAIWVVAIIIGIIAY